MGGRGGGGLRESAYRPYEDAPSCRNPGVLEHPASRREGRRMEGTMEGKKDRRTEGQKGRRVIDLI